jgi:hypothetical protein
MSFCIEGRGWEVGGAGKNEEVLYFDLLFAMQKSEIQKIEALVRTSQVTRLLHETQAPPHHWSNTNPLSFCLQINELLGLLTIAGCK